MTLLWVTWNGSARRHAAVRGVSAADLRNGSFPLMCGRWAPDGWDKTLDVAYGGRACKRCERAAAQATNREDGNES